MQLWHSPYRILLTLYTYILIYTYSTAQLQGNEGSQVARELLVSCTHVPRELLVCNLQVLVTLRLSYTVLA